MDDMLLEENQLKQRVHSLLDFILYLVLSSLFEYISICLCLLGSSWVQLATGANWFFLFLNGSIKSRFALVMYGLVYVSNVASGLIGSFPVRLYPVRSRLFRIGRVLSS